MAGAMQTACVFSGMPPGVDACRCFELAFSRARSSVTPSAAWIADDWYPSRPITAFPLLTGDLDSSHLCVVK